MKRIIGVLFLLQLVIPGCIAQEKGDTIALPWAVIADAPRFQYRGTMLKMVLADNYRFQW